MRRKPTETDTNTPASARSADKPEHLTFTVTGIKLQLRGRALLVLSLGVAAAMGGTIVIKLIF
ncbi:hypothetical protein [Sorangium sp. So ce1097]|uniref:hypothetical protein n=1 Tax=Sorangium sp. So ce1097 TaxID=3133330 RepID=UPI003F623606